jgi:hypothetical protein
MTGWSVGAVAAATATLDGDDVVLRGAQPSSAASALAAIRTLILLSPSVFI